MTVAIPLTKAQDLTRQLTDLCNAQAPIDELTSRRFRRDVEAAQGFDPFNAALARTLLAVLHWDEDAIRRNIDDALKMQGDYDTYDFAATAWQLIGDYENAAAAGRRASELARTDLSLLRKAISYTYLDGQFRHAKELCDMYDKMSPAEPHPNRKALDEASALFEGDGFDQDQAAQCNRIAFKLLRERRVLFVSNTLECDEEDRIIMLRINVRADQKTVDELDFELGERLFDQISDYDPTRYWVGYQVKKDAQ
jgi:hypothetical protein